MASLEDSVCAVYQNACNEFMRFSKLDQKAEAEPFFTLACLLENLYPELIAAYRARMGA